MNNKGFTLIEMIVTTIIISILSAITIPNLYKSKINSELKNDTQKINASIAEAFTNANRTSQDLKLIFADNQFSAQLNNGKSATLNKINLENHINFDNKTIEYKYAGEKKTDNQELIIIKSKKTEKKYCFVFGKLIYIKGIYENSCINPENLKYDSIN